MKKPTKQELARIYRRNVKRLKKEGWTDEQIESYRRGFFKTPSKH